MNKITISLVCSLLIVAIHCATVDLTGTSYCSCDTFTTSDDCKAAPLCAWDGSACADVDCTTYKTPETCNVNGNCALQSDGTTCAAFTKCADYSYTNADDCKNLGCGAGEIKDTKYPCVDKVYKKCTEITDPTECVAEGCVFNTTCVAPKCADQTKDTCNLLRGDALTQIQLCSFNTTCADSEMNLNQTACVKWTTGLYSWNADSSLCESCASQSYGYLIAAFGTMMLVF